MARKRNLNEDVSMLPRAIEVRSAGGNDVASDLMLRHEHPRFSELTDLN